MARIKVRFKGIADRRIITKKDLASAGAQYDGDDLVWSRSNNWVVELDANEDVERVLRDQGHFTISAVKDDGEESLEANASDPNRVGDKVVDATTGAESDVPSGGGPTEASDVPSGTGRGRSTRTS